MYLSLKTIDVWAIDGCFTATSLFTGAQHLIEDHMILTIGSYNACKEIREYLESVALTLNTVPYKHSFEYNRIEFPNGRPYDLAVKSEILKELCKYSMHAQGSVDKTLFFDHLVAFRIGVPMLPLVSFHDAFNGGVLYLSGHYSEKDINQFVKALGCNAELVSNPESVRDISDARKSTE